jgi:hypothetical protein
MPLEYSASEIQRFDCTRSASSIIADAILTEPEGEFKGQAAISEAVTELLSKLPPTFSFKQLGVAIGHHGVGRSLWKAGPPNGPPAVTGMDVAHFKDGRIERLFVFLDPARS